MAHALLTGRPRVARDGDALTITFRLRDANRVALVGAVAAAVLAFIAFPVLIFAGDVQGSPGDDAGFVLLAIAILVALTRMLFGREEIRVERDLLAISTVVLGPLRRTRRVPRSDVRALRVDVPAGHRSFNRMDNVVTGGGSILVDTARGELRFGARVDEKHAQQVVTEIERFWR